MSRVPAARTAGPATPPATSSPPIIGSSRSPALAGSSPSTLCRYWGNANKIAYSATDTAIVAAVPPVNRRSRNSAGSITG